MHLELILALFLIICITIWQIRRKNYTKYYNAFPGPAGWPIIGNALELLINHEDMPALFRFYNKKWPKYFRFSVCHLRMIVITNAKDAETILTSSTLIDKASLYQYVHPWLATGLLTSTGRKWQTRRKLLTPSFHFRILENFMSVFNEQCDTLIEVLNQNVNNPTINIYSFITLCTLDIICESVMGVKVDAQINYKSPTPYVHATERIKTVISSRMNVFYLWPDRLFELFPEGREHAKCLKILHSFTDKVIRERKVILQQKSETESEIHEKKKYRPFLDLLLEASDSGKNLSDSDIREEVDTFMFAGHDTTAVGISWALFLLGNNPHVQQKVHEELDSIFGDDKTKHATIDDLKRMKYLDCVIKESQRIFPSVPILAREVKTDIVVDGKIIPTGTTTFINVFLLHKDADVFPNPDTFDPSRFFPENCLNRSPFAYVPFSAGPRNCIGQKFAMLEMKSVLSRLLRSFTIKSLEAQDQIKFTLDIVTMPKYGINVHLKPRK